MEKRIENVTREELANALGKYIKGMVKNMGEKTNMKLPISLTNWGSRINGQWKWTSTEVAVRNGYDTTKYIFKDKQIDDETFANMLRKVVADNAVRAFVVTEEYSTGWYSKEVRFKHIEVFAAPCKEFTKLSNMIAKYTNKGIGNYDVFSVSVCGKRSSWSDSGSNNYLCYQPTKCQRIIDYIRSQKSSKDILSVEVREYFSHGDEGDYRCAMYQESEWYGERGAELVVTITTPKGKVKLSDRWGV